MQRYPPGARVPRGFFVSRNAGHSTRPADQSTSGLTPGGTDGGEVQTRTVAGATPGVLHAAERAGDDLLTYLSRHARGDWGVVGKDDARANDWALSDGTRLLSAYLLRDGTTRIWIITEADRSATTVLLPSEY